jgi:uncharacterized protein
MDTRFAIHNLYHESVSKYLEEDPHLRRLKNQPWVHRSKLLDEFPKEIPGIYMVGGGRQVGKTTVLKQWIAELLQNGISAQAIQFLTGELIDDHHSLLLFLKSFVEEGREAPRRFLILDEVTYIREWNKAIKYAADAGWLESTIFVLTGSDLNFLKEGLILLPGRRGKAGKVDFHLHPLSFRDFIHLKYGKNFDSNQIQLLEQEFGHYLIHGGFLTAINDWERLGKIEDSTFRIYSDWIRGDALKRGKQESYLKEILAAIVKHNGSQVSWNTLCKSLSIDHPKTVSDYADLLSRMDCLYIQSALLEDKWAAAPKKPKKLVLVDPFIFHSVTAYLNSALSSEIYKSVQSALSNPELTGNLVENVVVSHYRRVAPTYYIKAEGEVDLAVVKGNHFKPIEVKWTGQVRIKDLKQIRKYKNGLVLCRSTQTRIEGVETEFLPAHLYGLDAGT